MRGLARRVAVSSFVTVTMVGAFAGSASAAPGDLDPDFGGGDGQVATQLGSGGTFGEAVLILGNGKIVVAGETRHSADDIAFGLARYRPNGTLDPTFGNGGKVVTNLTGEFDAPYEIVRGASGRFYVAGYAGTNFAVVRYLPDGHLDHSFSGDGKAIVPFSSGSSFAYDMAIAKGGKLVLVGQVDNASSISRFAVVRLMPDGSPDHSFSGDGRVSTDLGPNSYGYAVVALQDGSLVVTGDGHTTAHTSAAIVKYRPNGTLDPDFGEDGFFVDEVGEDFSPSDMVRLPSGKFLLEGSYRTGPATFEVGVLRYRADGHPDAAFGPNGLVTHDFGGESTYSSRMARDGNGVLIAVSQVEGSDNTLGVVRLLANGGIDTSFGDQGEALGTKPESSVGDVAVQRDGRIVVAGSVGATDDDSRFLVARFLGS